MQGPDTRSDANQEAEERRPAARGRLRVPRALFVLLALLLALVAGRARAQEAGRAGLVVVTGGGDVITRCVDFTGDSIRGDELLARSGLEVVSDPQSSMGATVCSIEGVGCKHPAEDCFCKCQGSPCVYWSYWRFDAVAGWNYSGMGASNTQVKNGAVEGWVWGDGTSGEAPEPPALTFADICPVEGATEPQEGAVTAAVVAADLGSASAPPSTPSVAQSTESTSAPPTAGLAGVAGLAGTAGLAGAAGLAGTAVIVAVPLLLLALLWWRRR